MNHGVDENQPIVKQVRSWFVNPPPHGIGGKLAIALADEHDRIRAALEELVATKEIHDRLEVLRPLDPKLEEEYRKRRVAAWDTARRVLKAIEAS